MHTSIPKIQLLYYSKTCLKRTLKKRPIIGFQDRSSLNAGQKYCRMLSWSILQYFRPSLSYRLSLRPLFCLFLSGCLRQVLLYSKSIRGWASCVAYCLYFLSLKLNFSRVDIQTLKQTFHSVSISILSSFAIISLGKRELVALLKLSS